MTPTTLTQARRGGGVLTVGAIPTIIERYANHRNHGNSSLHSGAVSFKPICQILNITTGNNSDDDSGNDSAVIRIKISDGVCYMEGTVSSELATRLCQYRKAETLGELFDLIIIRLIKYRITNIMDDDDGLLNNNNKIQFCIMNFDPVYTDINHPMIGGGIENLFEIKTMSSSLTLLTEPLQSGPSALPPTAPTYLSELRTTPWYDPVFNINNLLTITEVEQNVDNIGNVDNEVDGDDDDNDDDNDDGNDDGNDDDNDDDNDNDNDDNRFTKLATITEVEENDVVNKADDNDDDDDSNSHSNDNDIDIVDENSDQNRTDDDDDDQSSSPMLSYHTAVEEDDDEEYQDIENKGGVDGIEVASAAALEWVAESASVTAGGEAWVACVTPDGKCADHPWVEFGSSRKELLALGDPVFQRALSCPECDYDPQQRAIMNDIYERRQHILELDPQLRALDTNNHNNNHQNQNQNAVSIAEYTTIQCTTPKSLMYISPDQQQHPSKKIDNGLSQSRPQPLLLSDRRELLEQDERAAADVLFDQKQNDILQPMIVHKQLQPSVTNRLEEEFVNREDVKTAVETQATAKDDDEIIATEHTTKQGTLISLGFQDETDISLSCFLKSSSSSCIKKKEESSSGSSHKVSDNSTKKKSEGGTKKNRTMIIELNVGGNKFATSVSTLTCIPGSYFEAMVSDRHNNNNNDDSSSSESNNSFFIDRDGKHFRHILNYLRCGGVVVTLPEKDKDKEELMIEADYYGLNILVGAILRPQLDVSELLPPHILDIQQEEYKFRQKFVRGDYSTSSTNNNVSTSAGSGTNNVSMSNITKRTANLYSGLVSLFSPKDDNDNILAGGREYHDVGGGGGHHHTRHHGHPMRRYDTFRTSTITLTTTPSAPVRYNAKSIFRQDQQYKSSMFLFDLWRQQKKDDNEDDNMDSHVDDTDVDEDVDYHHHNLPATVSTVDEFETNFNKAHPNILNRLQELLRNENFVIAGGSVLRALTVSDTCRTHDYWDTIGDIDIFIYGLDPIEAKTLVQRIFIALAVDNEKWVVVRTRGVINIHNADTKLQIVLRIYDTPTEILMGFDVDCCCCCYDGRDVKITRRCLSALVTGVNVLNPSHAWPKKASYELRLAKYAHRGYAVYVPGINYKKKNRSKLFNERIQKSPLKNLTGCSRFLKIVMEMNSAPPICSWIWNPGTARYKSRPASPREIKSLRPDVLADTMTPDELLVNGLTQTYDDEIEDVFIPDVYTHSSGWDGYPDHRMQWQWWEHDFPLASETRDKAIQTILYCTDQDVPEGIPSKLTDAWNTEKRSREYLNDEMDKIDVDTVYYASIYDDEDNKNNRPQQNNTQWDF